MIQNLVFIKNYLEDKKHELDEFEVSGVWTHKMRELDEFETTGK